MVGDPTIFKKVLKVRVAICFLFLGEVLVVGKETINEVNSFVTKDTNSGDDECPLSRLIYDILTFGTDLGKDPDDLPTLKEVRSQDPNIRWSVSSDKECFDEWDSDDCAQAARLGMCSGRNWEYENHMAGELTQEQREHVQKTGFEIKTEDMDLRQVRDMMTYCRKTCREFFKNVSFSDLPEPVRLGRGYEDVIVNDFGHKIGVCDLSEGFTSGMRERFVGNSLVNNVQPRYVPSFTETGFKKMKIPKQLFGKIMTFRKRSFSEKAKNETWTLETCDAGIQNCARVVESHEECRIVSNEKYYFHDMGSSYKKEVFHTLRPMVEDWVDDKVELVGTAVYGFRRYKRGAWLQPHTDHLKTHVISAIFNIAQDVSTPWPLQILDHQGTHHDVILEAGDMVLYESAKLVHGRNLPLQGKYFDNFFAHFMPRSSAWYQDDLGLVGRPSKVVKMEDLVEANGEMVKQRESRREEKLMEEEVRKKLSTEEMMQDMKYMEFMSL